MTFTIISIFLFSLICIVTIVLSPFRYHVRDVIVGKIYFLLVRLKIKLMELHVVKREQVSAGKRCKIGFSMCLENIIFKLGFLEYFLLEVFFRLRLYAIPGHCRVRVSNA
jgi:hypothetical protein